VEASAAAAAESLRHPAWLSLDQAFLMAIGEQRVPFDPGDVRLLAHVARPEGHEAFDLAGRLTDRLLAEGIPSARAVADELADLAVGWNPMYRISSPGAAP